MYTLSQPQKILVGCSFVIFFLGISLIIYLASSTTETENQNDVQSQEKQENVVEFSRKSSSSGVASSISSSMTSSLLINGSSSSTSKATSSAVSSVTDSSDRGISTSSSSVNKTKSSASSQTQFQSNLLERINNARANELLEPLSWNNTLTEVATAHSFYIAKAEKLTHENDSGQSYQERCIAAGSNCQNELLNYSEISTAQAVFEQLTSVQDKKKIILDEQLTEIGIGYTQAYTVLVLN